jgi:iron(III) transport system ATP-binding protein
MHRIVDHKDPTATAGSPVALARPYLRVSALSKRFGSFTALEAIELEVREGEFICFLGPSGCGKTTLLRAIAGLDPQTDGRIEMRGKDVSHAPPAARDFGIVFQSYALFPNQTVAQNIGYGLVNRRAGRAAVKARVEELLALVGLTEHADKYPVQLSGGQQQRVALARALATSPSLLLLDEPLSALDARVRVRLRDEIKLLQRRLGVTTIMVTHDQEEALAMADRIVVMNRGRIEQTGTPAEIYASPRTPFVADFVGTMTFLDGNVVAPDRVEVGKLTLSTMAGAAPTPNARVRLGFRPEDVQVRNLTDGTPNLFKARLIQIDYLGSFCRATLEPEAAPGLRLTADLSANAMRDLGLAAGQSILMSLRPQTLHVFTATAAGTPP